MEHFVHTFNELRAVFAENMRQHNVPGGVVGVRYGDTVLAAGVGVTSIDHPLDVTPETLFQIGSVTKTYIATVVMLLVDAGKLELDAPVRRYLPDFKLADESTAEHVTLEHLLTHVGGWDGDLFTPTGDGDDALAKYAALVQGQPQFVPLGTGLSYNNSGFSLVGRIIEVVTGKTFEAAMQELVFTPLGLSNTFFFPNDIMTHRFAVGHVELPGKPQIVAKPWGLPRSVYPAGAITCSVHDLLHYAAFHNRGGVTADGKRLLSDDHIATMRRVRTSISPTGEQMALSWFTLESSAGRLYGHGGSTNGQQANLLTAPDKGFAVAFLTNSDHGSKAYMASRRWAMKAFLDVDLPRAEPQPSADGLAQYAGLRFSRPTSDVAINLDGDGALRGTVTVRSPLGVYPDQVYEAPLAVTAYPDLLVVTDGELKDSEVILIRDAAGEVALARMGLRLHPRV